VTFQTHLSSGDSDDTIRVVNGDGSLPKARRERWAWRLQLLAVGIAPAVILARSFDGDVQGWWVILVAVLVVLVLAALANLSFSSSLRMFSDRVAADPEADLIMPVRTTADLSVLPPGLRTPYEEWFSQQRSRLMFVAKSDSFEIRRWPRPGRSQGARLRFASITSVKVGTAQFFDEVNRAVVVQGIAKGRPYTVALAPLRLGTWFVTPVPDEEFLRFFTYLESKSTPAGQD
jgi:hypothetical protein